MQESQIICDLAQCFISPTKALNNNTEHNLLPITPGALSKMAPTGPAGQ